MGAISPSRLRELIDSHKRGEDVDQEFEDYITSKLMGLIPYNENENKKESDSIQKIDKNPKFSRLIELIGKHESLYLVKIGIYIMTLNDKGKRQLIDTIKEDVANKYGTVGVNILYLGSTGVVFDVIDYLDTLNLKGKTKDEIITEFERILDEWEQITFFITKDHDENHVRENIEIHMKLGQPIFFVFAYGSACNVAMRTIAKMNVERLIRQKDHYLFFVTPDIDKAGRIKMAWRFEKINPSETSEFKF